MHACCLWGDTWTCTIPPTPYSSFNEKEIQTGTASYPPQHSKSPYFPSSLCTSMPFLTLRGYEDLHAQAEVRKDTPIPLRAATSAPHRGRETCHKSCTNWTWVIHKGYPLPLRHYQCSHWLTGEISAGFQICCKNQLHRNLRSLKILKQPSKTREISLAVCKT